MNCPLCKQDTIILETRGAVRRRRCTACKGTFATVEVLKQEHDRQQRLIKDAQELAGALLAGG